MAAPSPGFGAELKDAFKPVNTWVANGIAWLDDIQSFYRERALIEKEYSVKLNQLAKKYWEKKSKKISSLSVGETPFMTPGSLESASLTTWTSILNATEELSKEHEGLSNDLSDQIADPLKNIATRYEDFRKRHEAMATKLVQEKDSVYAELKKTKEKYDHQCKEVENARVKAEKSYDSSKLKAERAKQQELQDMNNVKNTYLIAINVTNRHKQKYYHEDLPMLLDSMQDLNECRVAKLNSLWSLSASLESSCHKRCIEHLSTVISEIERNLPHLDSAMYIEHNAGGWKEPPDFDFEPSMVWRDTDEIVVDEPAQVFLRNLMTKSRACMEEVRPELEKKRRELENLKRSKDSVKLDESKATNDADVTKGLFNTMETFIQLENKFTTYKVEIDTILLAVGDIERGAATHKFKQITYKIPTKCDLCGERLWGSGYTCKDCGYSAHQKCEMKVPATCPGVLDKAAKKALKDEKRASMAQGNNSAVELPSNGDSTLSRSNTMNSLSSSYASGGGVAMGPSRSVSTNLSKAMAATSPGTVSAPRPRILAPPPEKYVSAPSPDPIAELPAEESHLMGKMLYGYTATGEGEISIEEGKAITILEPDDGSGWIRVKSGLKDGLVPASYVDSIAPGPVSPKRPTSGHSSSATSITASIAASTTVKKKGPAVAPKRGAKKVQYAEALYDYEARTSAEFSMQEGDRFVLVKPDSGDGWAEVELNGIRKSVPANYIQAVN